MRNGRVFKEYHQYKLSRVVLVKHELPPHAHVELHITAHMHMRIANSITLVSAAVSLLRQA